MAYKECTKFAFDIYAAQKMALSLIELEMIKLFEYCMLPCSENYWQDQILKACTIYIYFSHFCLVFFFFF